MVRRRAILAGGSTLLAGLASQSAGAQTAGGPRPPYYNLLDFGGAGDGRTLNTAAFERALKTCAEAGGGAIYVPPGEYLSGPILLHSNTVLHLAAGAVVKGSPRLQDYPAEPQQVSGESAREGLVTARDAENVAILGRGAIDGNSMPFHSDRIKGGSDWNPKFTRQKDEYMNARFGTETGPLDHGERPGNLVRFINCRNVLLEGVTVRNSPTWTMLFDSCEDVRIDGLNINSLASGRRIPNDDGMDLRNSTNIRISNCNIATGDDCIAVFGSRNLVVSNCTLAARSAGIRVGYEEGAKNCTFENLTIDANCGLKVNVRASGSVEDVLFSNIVMRTGLITGHWWGKGEPVNVSAVPLRAGGGTLGRIRRVRFSNILAESENSALVYGSPDSPVEDVVFDNFDLRMRNSRLQPSYGGNFDLRAAADFSQALFEHGIPGLFFRHATGLRIRGFRLRWDDDVPPFFTHAIEGEEFRDVEIQGFEGRQAAGAAIALRNGNGVTIRDCRAAGGTGTFLEQTGVTDQRLFVNNDLGRAARAFAAEPHGFAAAGNLMPKG